MKIFLIPCFVACLTAAGQTPPRLSIDSIASQTLRIAWTNSAIGFELEGSTSLAPGTLWQPVKAPLLEQNSQYSISVNATQFDQFFRLRLPPSTGIADSSPINGETGVAVTRETIIHFTAPLSKNAVLTANNFYAGSGGRRLLSRVELSSDRTKATLFYLEPMPGSTRITAVFDGKDVSDELGRPLDVDGDGVPGGLAIITFDTLNLTPLAGTGITGTVYASELAPGSDTGTNAVNKPLAGVTITVDGMEQSLRTVTDTNGNFTLNPVPPGRFFVHIDGRTVTDLSAGIRYPDQSYYPFVGKAWEAAAGRTNNLAGETGKIYLPLITVGTLQPVSMTADTTISFPPSVLADNPALDGVSVTIRANSLFSDNGARGGKVGIAPVPPDRLPGPLPPGAQLPLVITVQTDGPLNFDKPAPVCFPNLPNPTTAKAWPPGTRGSLISFNHKKGVWEDVGGMTVSADGKFFCTDAGVGIVQPGWHGAQCPKPDKPKPNPDPEDCKPDAVALKKCFDACFEAAQVCREIAFVIHAQAINLCKEIRATHGAKDGNTCLRNAAKDFKGNLDKCTAGEADCDRTCIACNGTPRPKSAQAHSPGFRMIDLAAESSVQSIKDQIWGALTKIDDLLAPFLDSDADIPSQVVTQIDTLIAQANAVAGGDAVQFLENVILELERSNAALEDDLRLNRGNAPGYPVLYAAEIQRSGDKLILRGQTEPFGQYLVFVPPDGQLVEVTFYDPQTKQYGSIFPYFRPEAPYELPRFTLHALPSGAADFDRDGLADAVEIIYGTEPNNADTDGDGIPDGAEVDQGTDPLGGLVAQTGIIATVKMPGSVVDVAAGNGLVATAEGVAGVSILNTYKGENPIVLAHVPIAGGGNAQRVSIDGTFIAVAAGDAGLVIIDEAIPATANITQQVPLTGASAVTAAGGMAFVGTTAGTVASVNLVSGRLVDLISLNTPIRDLAVLGEYVYALTDDRLFAISFANRTLSLSGSTASPFPAGPNLRLFVGGEIAYAVHRTGYNTFDLTNPAQPVLVQTGTSQQFGWKQMTLNGSGLALAAVGPNSTDDGTHDISLYDVSNPTNAITALTTFPTPGLARAVALWEGLAYVADDTAGLQVINYLAYDGNGIAPQIKLSTSFNLAPAQIAENSPARVTADASDDVQVRNVEFYLDGTLVEKDGNFPFEFRFIAPQRTTSKTSFSLRARSTDTGGNFTWSDEVTVTLLPDTAPPQVTRISPRSIVAGIRSVSVSFDEQMDPGSLTPSALKLWESGPDALLGTADDVEVLGGVRTMQTDLTATLQFPGNFNLGSYRVVVGRDFADRRGNHLATEVTRDFRVIDAVYWVNPGGGDWSKPGNWSTGTLPGPSDDVLIAPDILTVISYSNGNNSIRSLLSDDKIILSGGRLEVTGTMQVSKLELSGGTLASAHVLDGGELRLRFGTLEAVTLDTDVTLEDSDQISVLNGLTVNRKLTIASSDNNTGLRFQGAQTLGGTGEVILAGTGFANYLTVDGLLTVDTGITIHGLDGRIGSSGVPLVNRGTISADVAGAFHSIQILAQRFTNLGTLEAKNDAVLQIQADWTNSGIFKLTNSTLSLGGTFTTLGIGSLQRSGGAININGLLDNTGSVFALNAGTGSWNLEAGTIRGGRITTANGAILRAKSGTLDGVTLDSDLILENNDQISVLNGLTVNQKLTLTSSLNPTGLRFRGDQTLGGVGEVVFGGGAGNLNYLSPEAALTITSSLTIHGGNGTLGQGGISLLNQGTILAERAGETIKILGQSFTNSGTVQVKNGSSISIESDWINNGIYKITESTLDLAGTFKTAGLGTVQRNGGTVNIRGVLNNTNSVLALDRGTGSLTLEGGTIRSGSVTTADGTILRAKSGTLNEVTLDTDLTLENNDQVSVVNGLTVNRKLTLASSGNPTGLRFQGAQTLGGVGEVIFAGGAGGLNYLAPQEALTIASGLFIHGGNGTVGQFNIPLTNQGTISADLAGTVITIQGTPFINTGTTNAVNGGKLVFTP